MPAVNLWRPRATATTDPGAEAGAMWQRPRLLHPRTKQVEWHHFILINEPSNSSSLTLFNSLSKTTHVCKHTHARLWTKCDSSQSGAIIPWLLSHYGGLIGSTLCFQRCSKLLLMKFQPQQKTAFLYCCVVITYLTSTSGALCLQSAAFLEAMKEDFKKKVREELTRCLLQLSEMRRRSGLVLQEGRLEGGWGSPKMRWVAVSLCTNLSCEGKEGLFFSNFPSSDLQLQRCAIFYFLPSLYKLKKL